MCIIQYLILVFKMLITLWLTEKVIYLLNERFEFSLTTRNKPFCIRYLVLQTDQIMLKQ